MSSKKMNILAIDDNNDNLITLKALLKEAFPQAEVITETSGQKGIEAARRHNPDLILLDIIMPEMDGYAVCRKLKADADLRDIPVVFITAMKADKQTRIEALDAGGDAFLSKPVDEIELVAQVRAMVKVKSANIEKRDEQSRLRQLVEDQTTELKKSHAATLNILEDLQEENRRRKQSEAALKVSEKQYAFLAQTAFDLVNIPTLKEIYAYSARKLYELLDEQCIVAIVDFLTDDNTWKMQHIIGVGNKVEKLSAFFGANIHELEGEMSTKHHQLIQSGSLVELELDLPGLFNNKFAKDVGNAVMQLMGINKMFCVAIKEGNTLLGNVTIATNKHSPDLNAGLIETFVLQVSNFVKKQKAEDALQENEKKFRSIAEQLTDLIAITDEKGVIQYASPASESLFGVSPRLMEGVHFTHFLDESANHRASGLLRETLSKPSGAATNELLMKRVDGTRFTGELKAVYHEHEGKKGSLVTIRDISDRKRAAKAFRESENKFRTLFETANDAIFLMDQHVFTDCNPRALKMFAASREQIIGKTPMDVSPAIQPNGMRSDELALKKIDNALNDVIKSFEWQQKRLDGTLFQAEVSLNAFIMNDKKYLQAIVRDITERKRSAERLAESERKHRSLIEQMQEGLLVVDNDDVIQFVNPMFCKMLGYDEADLIGKVGYEVLIKEADKDLIIKKNLDREQGRREQYEVSMITKSGKEIIMLMNAAPLKDAAGKVTGSMSTCVDITERKKNEIELRESEERFRALHNASFGGIIIHDKGMIMACNQGLSGVTGYSMEELVGMNAMMLITDRDRETVMNNILAGYEKPYEVVCLRKDQTELPVRIQGKNIPYKGKMVRVAEFRDITLQKRTEKIREIQYEIARSVLSAMSFESLIENILDQLQHVIDTSNFFVAMYHAGEDSLKRVVFRDEKDDFVEWKTENSLSGWVVKNGRRLFLKKDEEAQFAIDNNLHLQGTPAEAWLGVPILVSDKPAGVMVIQSYDDPDAIDPGVVSLIELVAHETGVYLERKNLLNNLVEAKEMAEAGDRLKTAFMNNISHEIRTPLNGILGFGRMLAQYNVTESERAEYLNIVEKSSDRLVYTVTNYMDISLLVSRNMKINTELFDVYPVIDNIYEKLKRDAALKGLEAKLLMHNTNENVQMYTDRELISKAIMHLANNAVKFTPAGTVTMGCKQYRDSVLVYVKDTGVGISNEARERVFENFGQEEISSTRKFEGSGLGLSISKGIAELVGGRVWMKTEKNVGSEFYISLPCVENERVEPIPEKAPEIQYEANLPLVLLAEDEESNWMYMKIILKKAGCKVLHALNGQEAVELCKQHPEIKLVLMDIKMPVMNGVEATRQIKALRNQLPIVAITAHAITGDEHRFKSAGCDGYVAKPFEMGQIFELLEQYGIIRIAGKSAL